MSNIFEDMARGLANVVAPEATESKILNMQNGIRQLQEEKEKIYAEIGKRALEAGDTSKYEDLVQKINDKDKQVEQAEQELNNLKEQIKAEEEEKKRQEQEQQKVFCTNCGTENNTGVKFCRECGTKLVTEETTKLFCTSCGKENTAGTKFCINCGNKF